MLIHVCAALRAVQVKSEQDRRVKHMEEEAAKRYRFRASSVPRWVEGHCSWMIGCCPHMEEEEAAKQDRFRANLAPR